MSTVNLPELSELEHDLLTEMFNLGVGRASSSLSRMVSQEVLLSIPTVEFRTRRDMARELGEDIRICSIQQSMQGAFTAQSLLLFPMESGLKVVRHMLGSHISDEMLAELQQEALSEIGNVVLNACIGAIAQSMDTSFEVGLPSFDVSDPKELLQVNSSTEDDVVLLIHICMTLAESEVTGYLAFVLGEISLRELQSTLDGMLGRLKIKTTG